jgi:hypothetical protein
MPRSAGVPAYDALLAAMQASMPSTVNLPAGQIFDGLPTTWLPDEYAALTGIVDVEKAPGAMAGSGRGPQKEHFGITGLLHAYSGGSEEATKVVRDRVDDFLTAIDALLQADPTIGVPFVLWSTLTTYELVQGVSANAGGRVAEMTFVVTLDTYIT